MRILTAAAALFAVYWLPCVQSQQSACIGEYQQCPGTTFCVLIVEDCGRCSTGYMCPDRKSCAENAWALTQCPGTKGTHYDWTLTLDERIQYLADQLNLTEMISQMVCIVEYSNPLHNGQTAFIDSGAAPLQRLAVRPL